MAQSNWSGPIYSEGGFYRGKDDNDTSRRWLAPAVVDNLGTIVGFEKENGQTQPFGSVSFSSTQGIETFRSWFRRPHAARAMAALQGTTPFWPRVDWQSAIIPQGTTQAALQDALTAASSAPLPRIVLLDRNITISTDLQVPDDVSIISLGATINSGNGSALIANQRTAFVGIRFLGARIRFAASTGQRNVRVVACLFQSVSGVGAVDDATTSDGTHHFEPLVALNEFINCEYGVYWQRTERGLIVGNRWTHNTPATGRGFFFVGGLQNLVEYNEVTNGIVGIGALVDRTLSRGFVGNIIRRNFVTGVSEEGISIDTYGNDGDRMAVVDCLDITSVSGTAGSSPAINVTRANITGITAATMAVTFLTGALVGRYFPLVAVATNGDGTIRLTFPNNSLSPAELSSIGAGNRVAVSIRMHGNVITENVVRDTFSPIMLWGASHRTLIAHNVVQTNTASRPEAALNIRGIEVRSLHGLTSTGATAVSGQVCSPVTQTFVVGNRIERGDIVFGGEAFSTEANVINTVDPLPHRHGANSKTPILQNWTRHGAGGYVSGEASASLSDSGGTFDEIMPEGIVLEDFSGYNVSDNTPGRSRGSHSAVGNGSNVTFSWQHGLPRTPQTVMVQPATPAAASHYFVSADATQISVTYATAPGNLTGLVWRWVAEL